MKNFKIILVKPRNPANIGAAARAMANFGLKDLSLVSPYPPVWNETLETADTAGNGYPAWMEEASKSAVGAGNIIRKAKVFETLKEALSDCVLALATSALKGRKPGRDIVALKDICEYISQKKAEGENIALVFGSEKTGLSNENISYCQAILNIPTSEKQPSINLGQAVALACYEIAAIKR